MGRETTVGTEEIKQPLQISDLNKKGLCDYAINIARGCLHGCPFCYVPSSPAIRTSSKKLQQRGVQDPQKDWGGYLFVREDVPEKVAKQLQGKQKWHETPEGKGVVMLCTTTDPYQNQKAANVTRETVKVLLDRGKRVRILTRGLLWQNDLELLANPNVTVGMSIPCLDNNLVRKIEPKTPLVRDRYKVLQKGKEAGCRIFIAMAPTPPNLTLQQIEDTLAELAKLSPEVIFWEPINPRGTNVNRMDASGIETTEIRDRKQWADNFFKQWDLVEAAAKSTNTLHLLHPWPDSNLEKYATNISKLKKWWNKPTIEQWEGDRFLREYPNLKGGEK